MHRLIPLKAYPHTHRHKQRLLIHVTGGFSEVPQFLPYAGPENTACSQRQPPAENLD